MRVYELAKELGIPNKEMLARLRKMGVSVQSHMSVVPRTLALAIRAQRAVPAPATPSVPEPAPPAPTVVAPPRPAQGPVVAFASLKGGVGKTTMSLCAAELLRRWPPKGQPGKPAPPTWPVVLIDADVAGTELIWVWNKDCATEDGAPAYRSTVSLIEILEERADVADKSDRLVQDAKALSGDRTPRGLVVPTFVPGTEMLPATLEWKQVLELTGTYVTRVLVRLIDALRNTGCAVVVDLPAFDVGFARYAALAVRELKGHVFVVTDCDIRSLRSTQHHQAANLTAPEAHAEIWRNVVVNRAPDATWRVDFGARLADAIAWGGLPTTPIGTGAVRPVIAVKHDPVTAATSLGGSARELFESITSYVQPSPRQLLDDSDRRRLRVDGDG